MPVHQALGLAPAGQGEREQGGETGRILHEHRRPGLAPQGGRQAPEPPGITGASPVELAHPHGRIDGQIGRQRAFTVTGQGHGPPAPPQRPGMIEHARAAAQIAQDDHESAGACGNDGHFGPNLLVVALSWAQPMSLPEVIPWGTSPPGWR